MLGFCLLKINWLLSLNANRFYNWLFASLPRTNFNRSFNLPFNRLFYRPHFSRESPLNRECSQVRMVDTISQPGCAECGAGGLVLTDYRPYVFLRALLINSYFHMLPYYLPLLRRNPSSSYTS